MRNMVTEGNANNLATSIQVREVQICEKVSKDIIGKKKIDCQSLDLLPLKVNWE